MTKIIQLKHGIPENDVKASLGFLKSFFKSSMRFLKNYYPLGSERPHEFYQELRDKPTALYEYAHFSLEDDVGNSSVNRVFRAVALMHENHMISQGVPYGSSTLRLMKYPAQATEKGGSVHYDFDFMTTVIGDFVIGVDREDFKVKPKTFYGDMANIYDPQRFKALLHGGDYYSDADRYTMVVFSVPPGDLVLNAELTVEAYYGLHQGVKY
ncbi:hypothetical protein AHIS2_p030 [Acaryochloris phage A-HIS2]|nr:hypothetical protein AHIS2_p030 [Acaryochloris phage A-HIS2]